MLAFLRSPEADLSNDPPGVTNPENEKASVDPAESIVARLDSASASDVNPGELTFEEGKSRMLSELTFRG